MSVRAYYQAARPDVDRGSVRPVVTVELPDELADPEPPDAVLLVRGTSRRRFDLVGHERSLF